jgi:PAS domain S-box-containing protein
MPNEKILIIDDEPVVIEAVRKHLKSDGYEIFSAGNGKEGLNILREINPILVVLDLRMPVMDGHEFLERAGLIAAATFSVIILTGHGDDDDIQRSYNLGVSAYLRKPFNAVELRGLVKNTIALKRSELNLADEIARRRQADELLKDRELRYRAVVESSSDAIISIDSRGYIIAFNGGAEKIFGHTRRDVIGRPLNVIVPERFVRLHREGLSRVASGGHSHIIGTTIETFGLRSDGVEFPVELTLSEWKTKEGAFFTGILRDITQRRKDEARMKRSAELQKIISAISRISLEPLTMNEQLDLILGIIFSITWIPIESGGCIFLVDDDNKTLVMTARSGMSDDEARTCLRLPIGKCLCGRSAQNMEIIFADCEDPRHEVKHLSQSPHGHCCVPIISSTQVLGVLNITLNRECKRDIVDEEFLSILGNTLAVVIERKRFEEELERSLAVLRATLESTTDGILVLDENGDIITSNRKFLDIWSLPESVASVGGDEEALRCARSQLKDPEAFMEAVMRVRQRPDIEVTDTFEFKDGRIVEQYSLPRVMGGRTSGRVLSFRDVTAQRLAERSIQASLKEKEVLIKEVHHRVKNNMNVISSLLRLQSESIKDEQYRDMFLECGSRVNSMAMIHERLYKSESLAHIDIREYVKSIAETLIRSYRERTAGVTLKLDISDVSMGVDTAIPCGLIINELVTNCLKYAFPAGRPGVIAIAMRQTQDGKIALTVSDDGVGIPESMDIRKMQTLGIQLVLGLTEQQLEGSVEVDTTGGTRFNIVIGRND